MVNSGRELAQFVAFSKWLRYEIDLQAADPLSATAEELMEKADTINHAQTLNYIQGALTRSALLDFIQAKTPEKSTDQWNGDDTAGVFYENYKSLLHKLEKPKSGEEIDIPVLGDLTTRLRIQFEKVSKRIAETQRRSILKKPIRALGVDKSPEVVDMTMNHGVCFDAVCPMDTR